MNSIIFRKAVGSTVARARGRPGDMVLLYCSCHIIVRGPSAKKPEQNTVLIFEPNRYISFRQQVVRALFCRSFSWFCTLYNSFQEGVLFKILLLHYRTARDDAPTFFFPCKYFFYAKPTRAPYENPTAHASIPSSTLRCGGAIACCCSGLLWRRLSRLHRTEGPWRRRLRVECSSPCCCSASRCCLSLRW